MQKIIDGKKYDTEKAIQVAEQDNRVTKGDFKYKWEGLYKTDKGNWFIAGVGGARTSYRKSAGDGLFTGGSDIIPVSESKAREILEKWDENEALEKYFGEQLEEA